MEKLFTKIRQTIKPKTSFREELRAQIYEYAAEEEKTIFQTFIDTIELPVPQLVIRIEKKYPLLERIKRSITGFINDFKRALLIGGGGVLAMLLVVPMFSLFSSPVSVASQSSFLRSIEGNVALQRGNKTIAPDNLQEISTGDTIITNANSGAELLFFEGTALRVDQDTQIEILQMRPHPLLFSTGGIQVKIIKGRIWVKTFQAADINTGIAIITPNGKILPNRAALEVQYIDGKESIHVFENTAQVSLEGVTVEGDIIISQNESIIFTPFDTFLPEPQVDLVSSKWIQKNKNKDASYRTEFLQTVSKKIKEQYFTDELSGKVHTFFEQEPTAEEVEIMIEQMNQFLLIASDKNAIVSPTITPDPTPTPTPPEIKGVVSKKIKKTIPQNIIYTGPQKIEQRESFPQDLENLDPPVQTNQENTEPLPIQSPAVKTAKDILEETKQKRYDKAAQNFSDQINAYTFEQSRATQSNNILDKIADSPENIQLLETMEDTAPKDVKKLIKRKRIQIIKEEKARVEALQLKQAAAEQAQKKSKADAKKIQESEKQNATLPPQKTQASSSLPTRQELEEFTIQKEKFLEINDGFDVQNIPMNEPEDDLFFPKK